MSSINEETRTMSIILFIVMPLGFLLVGKLFGLAVAASCFYSESGKCLGKTVSRWCMPIFPMVYLLLLVFGGEGDAGHGITIFGSATAFDAFAGILTFAIPIMGIYAGATYVIRDLMVGHECTLNETKEGPTVSTRA